MEKLSSARRTALLEKLARIDFFDAGTPKKPTMSAAGWAAAKADPGVWQYGSPKAAPQRSFYPSVAGPPTKGMFRPAKKTVEPVKPPPEEPLKWDTPFALTGEGKALTRSAPARFDMPAAYNLNIAPGGGKPSDYYSTILASQRRGRGERARRDLARHYGKMNALNSMIALRPQVFPMSGGKEDQFARLKALSQAWRLQPQLRPRRSTWPY